jgi:hypothetical protein
LEGVNTHDIFAIDYFGTVSPKDFKPISADEVNAERRKNLTKQQVYEIRKELKLEKQRTHGFSGRKPRPPDGSAFLTAAQE